jgi:L-threonylcarbamoyladenylate synthase
MPIVAPTEDNIARAGRYLAQGGLVAFPTETVYGLGADATNGLAVAGIFSAKGRPSFNPLIIHIAEPAQAARLAVVNDRAQRVMAAFWPGPLTLVLPARPGTPIEPLATAGLETIALRCPAHPVAQALLRAARVPIAAPSANRSGHVSATTAEHVAADFGDDVSIVLDAGPAPIGLESTILDLTADRPRLLRTGAVTREDLERIIGPIGDADVVRDAQDRPSAPGQLESHYAPRARVIMNARTPPPGAVYVAFGPCDVPGAHTLSATGDLTEAAANLFSLLRALDATGIAVIAVAPIPETGLGRAINDRLRRAAAPRPQDGAIQAPG